MPFNSKEYQTGATPVEWTGQHPVTFGRVAQVLSVRPTGRSTLYSDVKRGVFPKPVPLGGLVVWIMREVFAVNAAVAAGKSEDEIRSLVKRLESDRASLVA